MKCSTDTNLKDFSLDFPSVGKRLGEGEQRTIVRCGKRPEGEEEERKRREERRRTDRGHFSVRVT